MVRDKVGPLVRLVVVLLGLSACAVGLGKNNDGGNGNDGGQTNPDGERDARRAPADGGDCVHTCDGRCLQTNDLCNGISDCSNGRDESGCSGSCSPSEWTCTNGTCIEQVHRCDDVADCPGDIADEVACDMPTDPGVWECQDGTTIPADGRCQGGCDCPDCSDQHLCPACPIGSWPCNGHCFPKSVLCDGVASCPNGSDEHLLCTIDRREPDDDLASASPITSGETQFHTLHLGETKDADVVTFTLSATSPIVLETTGGSGDTLLWLLDANGQTIAFNDNGGVGEFSRISEILQPGTYYAWIRPGPATLAMVYDLTFWSSP